VCNEIRNHRLHALHVQVMSKVAHAKGATRSHLASLHATRSHLASLHSGLGVHITYIYRHVRYVYSVGEVEAVEVDQEWWRYVSRGI
jgi:hypothetical protein